MNETPSSPRFGSSRKEDAKVLFQLFELVTTFIFDQLKPKDIPLPSEEKHP